MVTSSAGGRRSAVTCAIDSMALEKPGAGNPESRVSDNINAGQCCRCMQAS